MNAASYSGLIDGRTEPGRASRARPGALAFVVFCGLALPAMAQSGPGAGGRPSDVRREVVRSLKTSGDRLAALARRIAEPADDDCDMTEVLGLLRIRRRQAEADHLKAKLAREFAEIAVREYAEGVRKQDENSIEIEITLTESVLVQADDLAATAETDDDKVWTRLNAQGAQLALNAKQMLKTRLIDYTAPRRIQELEAEVVRCRTVERVAEAKWKALQAEEARLAKVAADRSTRSTPERRGPAAVARAVAFHERIMAQFAEGAKGTESAEVLLKEIREPTNGLETLVDEAEAAVAADDLARWKPLVRAAIRRAPAGGGER